MQPNIYKYTRFIMMPIIITANFFQNNFTKYFTPMNMGPVTTQQFKKVLKSCFKKNAYILDYGCGTGYFSSLFKQDKYLGIDINKRFIKLAKDRYEKYQFLNFKEKNLLKKYKNKINYILLNNVIHHIDNVTIDNTFSFLKKNFKKNTTIVIIEPLMNKNFFSLEFFLKVIDIGNYITDKKELINRLKNTLVIKKIKIKQFVIGKSIILTCKFR